MLSPSSVILIVGSSPMTSSVPPPPEADDMWNGEMNWDNTLIP